MKEIYVCILMYIYFIVYIIYMYTCYLTVLGGLSLKVDLVYKSKLDPIHHYSDSYKSCPS